MACDAAEPLAALRAAAADTRDPHVLGNHVVKAVADGFGAIIQPSTAATNADASPPV